MEGELKNKILSVRGLYVLSMTGTVITMTVAAAFLYLWTGDKMIPVCCILLVMCALLWMTILMHLVGDRLSLFTVDICEMIDHMIDGDTGLQWGDDGETLLARISHRLMRLYEILQESRSRALEERQKIQMLVSDISHQVRTPVSNLRMVTDTLLTKSVTEQERNDFLQGIGRETDKLHFLFQALIKTSRLESGSIRLP